MFAGGLIWGAVVAGAFVAYFTKGGIPPLVEYMQERVSCSCMFE